MKKQMNEGISLIVLVITIIVMIILAGSIILTLSQNGIIDKANNAVNATNLKQVQEIAQTVWAEGYLNGDDETTIKANIVKQLGADVAENYEITVTKTGVTVTEKQTNEELVWDHAYIYENDEWSEKITNQADATGTIVATFYKTGEQATPGNFSGMVLPTDDAYKLVISGSGAITDSAPVPWTDEMINYMMGTSDKLPEIIYATETVIEEGITAIPGSSLPLVSSRELSIPSTLSDLGTDGIGYSGNITVASSNKNYIAESNVLYNKDKTKIIASSITNSSVTIPSSVTTIGAGAFANNVAMESIVIPDTVTTIEEWAFSYIETIKSIVIPDSVTTIGECVFSCSYGLEQVTLSKNIVNIPYQAFMRSNLKEVVIPQGVTSIEENAFSYCESLTTVTIPKSVIFIGNNAFEGSQNISTINYTGTADEWAAITINSGNDILETATINYVVD